MNPPKRVLDEAFQSREARRTYRAHINGLTSCGRLVAAWNSALTMPFFGGGTQVPVPLVSGSATVGPRDGGKKS